MIEFFSDIIETLLPAIVMILVAILFIGFLFFGMTYVEIKYINNVPVKCYVQDNLVYEGTSAAIGVSSSGDTTTLKINSGFLYLFPKKLYTGQGIKVEGKKP